MSLSIRTNLSSLNAQRNLSSTQLHLDSSLSRLSSGFRITKAGDDAAGLGISTKLESQIRSYNQAVRNANDGLSVVQSTEAALNEQASILTRMRELAMQSASDGVGNVERGYVNQESTKLLAELQRISQVAEYNGTKLLDGSAASLDFQVGIAATGNDVISLTTLNGTTAAAGAAAPAAGALSAVVLAGSQAASDAFVADFAVNGSTNSARLAAQAAGVAAGLNNNSAFFMGYVALRAFEVGGSALVTATRSGGDGGNATLAGAMAAYAASMQATSGDYVTSAFAASAAVSNASAGDYAQGLFFSAYTQDGGVWPAPAPLMTVGSAAFTAGLAALGAGTVPPGGPVATPATGGGLGVAGLTLSTKASALAALASIDAALETISSNRATLGAAGNRFQSAIANIQSFSESLSAANSRIKDVDVAEETSRMSRSQILLQAGVSVLAQANQMPQMALKLLG